MRTISRSLVSTLAIAGLLVTGTATPVAASEDLAATSGARSEHGLSATYTWFDRTGTFGIRYYDHVAGSQAGSFSRTGVQAEAMASGSSWSTTVWFGSHSSTAGDQHSITGPRSFAKTSFRITHSMSDEGRIGMRARLLGAKLAGTSASTSRTESSEDLLAITAEEIRAGRVPGQTVTKIGADEQVEFWISDDTAETCLYTTWDEYAAYTCEDPAEVRADGMFSETSGPEFEAEVRVPAVSELASARDGVTFSVNHLD